MVLEKMRPPSPEPLFARPWGCLRKKVNLFASGQKIDEKNKPSLYLCKAQTTVKPVCQKWLRGN